MYAIACIRTTKPMYVPVYINSHRLIALLNIGSTHNFINTAPM